ncbi:MAG: DUF3078 domain-containing protein [Gemmatimonadetes bacterium]|nr:DUF3078 domain-containing protein [Gemmatimonadota bacterium]
MRRPGAPARHRPRLPFVPLLALTSLAGLVFPASPLAAQSPPVPADSLGWHRQAVGQLNLTQVTLDNWSQGGESSVAWQLTGAAEFDYLQPKYAWTNSMKLGYGRTKLGDSDFRKSIDEIRLESVVTGGATRLVNPFVSLIALTQFSTGYKYQDSTRTATSAFFDPAYFTESLGLAYQPSKVFVERVGAAVKETFTNRYNMYADNPATPKVEKNKVEGGITSESDVNAKFQNNVLLTSKLELFSNLKGWRRTDVNWQSTLTVQLSKYVNFNLDVRLLYDSTVSPRRQLKQSLALGLTYAFLTDTPH